MQMKKDEMVVSFDDSHVEWSYKINNVFTTSINEVYTKLCEAIGSKIYRGKMRAFPSPNAAPAKLKNRQSLRTTNKVSKPSKRSKQA